MAITYSSTNGTIITSYLCSSTLGSQTNQTGNNTMEVTGLPSTLTGYGGNVGDGTNGTGDNYTSRLVILRRGTGTEEIRFIQSQLTGGFGLRLTVSEDWDVVPASGDNIDLFYELADIEDGGAGGGIALSTRTGIWEFSRIITIGNGTNPAGLFIKQGEGMECADRGTSLDFLCENNGWFQSGYDLGGAAVSGARFSAVDSGSGELWASWASGSTGRFYATAIFASRPSLDWDHIAGSDVQFFNCSIKNTCKEMTVPDTTFIGCSLSGDAANTERVEFYNDTIFRDGLIENIIFIDSQANTTAETLTVEQTIWININLTVRNNKIWNIIDPTWPITDYTDTFFFDWTPLNTGTGIVNERKSVKVTVTTAAGTALQNALVNIYENTQTADLVVEDLTDANGEVDNSWIYQAHTPSSTTTYGGTAFQVGKWLYLPFVATQAVTEPRAGQVTLVPDNNIVQTTQATAITAGSGITWNEDTNPSELFDFTGGTGTLAVGMVLTFSPSTAVGTITQLLDGDSTAGTIHLDTRDATAIANGDTFTRTGGTAGTFSGTYTNNSKQPFSIHIDGNSLSYQTIYDYLAAIQTQTTLSATGELIWEWCRDEQGQPLFATGGSFYTGESNGKGIIIVNAGSGTADYFTDDAGVTWVPPTSVTVEVEVLNDSTGLAIGTTCRVFLARVSDDSVIISAACNASGVVSVPFSYTADVPIYGWAREQDLSPPDYEQKDFTGTITNAGFSTTIRLAPIT